MLSRVLFTRPYFLAALLTLAAVFFPKSARADWILQLLTSAHNGPTGSFSTAAQACQADIPTIPAPPSPWTVGFGNVFVSGVFGLNGVNLVCVKMNLSGSTPLVYGDSIVPSCGTGMVASTASPTGCVPSTESLSAKMEGETCCQRADPVDVATGNVFETVTDYETAGPNKLTFARYYNSISSTTLAGTMGKNWRHTYDRYISGSSSPVTVERQDGKQFTFTLSSGVWVTDLDVDYTLTHSGSTWTLTTPDDTMETYTGSQLTSIRARNGYTQTLTYNGSGQLSTVTDSYTATNSARQLTFTYDSNGLLQSVATPDSTTITYGRTYSGIIPTNLLNGVVPPPDQLTGVVYPATSGGTPGGTVTYGYNANLTGTPFSPYLLTSVTDENGNVKAQWTYDTYGRATSNQGYSGLNLTTFSYNDSTGARTVTNGLGEADTYSFTTVQNAPKVSSISRAATSTTAAASESFGYDSNGYLGGFTNWNGTGRGYANNAHGLPTYIIEAGGTSVARVTYVTYDGTWGRLPANIAGPGLTTSFTYDSNGNALTRTLTDQATGHARTWTYTYDATGETLTATDPLYHMTTFAYSAGHLTGIYDALTHTTTLGGFTGGGRPTVIYDVNGVAHGIAYDARQHIVDTSVVTSLVHLDTHYTWNANNELQSVIWPDSTSAGYVYVYEYSATYGPQFFNNDAAGNEFYRYMNALGNPTTTVSFDHLGNIALYRNALYDALGRKIQDSNSTNTKNSTFTYDNNGNVLTVTDPLGHVTHKAYDALNRLTSVTDAASGVTSYAYDGQDNVTQVTAPNGVVTSYVYDGFRERTQETSGDSGVTNYVYDAAGNLTQKTDAASVVTNYTYDALNRMLTRSYPADSSQTVTYTYDQSGHGYGVGRLTSVTDRAGGDSRSYDERGNLTSDARTIVATVFTTNYTYNGASRLASMTYPDGAVVTYGRDAVGNIASIGFTGTGSDSSTVISAATWLAFGPAASITYGDGEAETFSWDRDLNATGISSTTVGLTYGYDNANNVTSITDALTAANSQSFTYDALNRLTGATSGTGGYGTQSWTYDSNGNLTASVAGGVSTSYTTTSSTNRLASLTAGGTTTSFAYTPTGNLSTSTTSGVTTTHEYNTANRVSAIHTPSLYYGYITGADGNRAIKQNGANSYWTSFVYDLAGHLIYEADDQSGANVSEYIYLGDKLVANWNPAQHHLYTVHTDRLGTPVLLTDHNKAVNWKANPQPYGADPVITSSGPSGTPIQSLRLPGQFNDPEFGYNNNGWRTYNPTTGRYIQADPMGMAAGTNPYAYAGGNPETFTDPSGLCFGPLAIWCAQYAIEIGTAAGWAAFGGEAAYVVATGAPGSPVATEAAVVDAIGGSSAARMANASRLGKEGEDAVRAQCPIGDKTLININGRDRIPDGRTITTLSEVKNVAFQGLTQQLQDYSDYAQLNGLVMDLYTRSDTVISSALQRLINSGIINRLNIPGL